MKINIWVNKAKSNPVRRGPSNEYDIVDILNYGTLVLELDRITDCNGDVLWIKHLGNNAYKTSGGWTRVRSDDNSTIMQIELDNCLDVPLFHYSIDSIESSICELEKYKAGDDSIAICLALLKRELLILSHLNLDQLKIAGLSLDELEASIKDKDIILIDSDHYLAMKKAYDQVMRVKKILS